MGKNNTPFSTCLRSIFRWKKKCPPTIFVVLLAAILLAACENLVEFNPAGPETLLSDVPPLEEAVNDPAPSERSPYFGKEVKQAWAGSGYLYSSLAIGAAIEFPAQWGDQLRVYDYENTMRIDALVGWDENASDNGRLATIYKFNRQDWDTQSGEYRKGMFEGGPTIQILAENDYYVYVLKPYGGLIGFEKATDPGFEEYKSLEEAIQAKEYEFYAGGAYPWLQQRSADPLETVRSTIEGEGRKNYTYTVRVNSLAEDRTEAQRIRQQWIGSELAQSRGWSDEMLEEHFTAVLAHYYVEYDHTMTPSDDGYIKRYFYLMRNPENGLWSIVDNDSGSEYEPQSFPSATHIKEIKAERYSAAIGPYDANGDGVLQTLEFPRPDPELFGLTGTDAALFSAVSGYMRQKLYLDPEDTMLLLSSVTVYGKYDGENGTTHYVCDLWHGRDYNAGTHLAEGGAKFGSNWGGGERLARVTLSADGSLLEVLPTLDGENNTGRIYEICGPLTELAETLRVSGAEGRSLAPRDTSIFTRYLGYYFPSTLAVQENIKDFLGRYINEYSILVLDANEVTGMVDICLDDYHPEIVAEIKQLVEANYSCSDYLNFIDSTGAVNLG